MKPVKSNFLEFFTYVPDLLQFNSFTVYYVHKLTQELPFLLQLALTLFSNLRRSVEVKVSECTVKVYKHITLPFPAVFCGAVNSKYVTCLGHMNAAAILKQTN